MLTFEAYWFFSERFFYPLIKVPNYLTLILVYAFVNLSQTFQSIPSSKTNTPTPNVKGIHKKPWNLRLCKSRFQRLLPYSGVKPSPTSIWKIEDVWPVVAGVGCVGGVEEGRGEWHQLSLWLAPGSTRLSDWLTASSAASVSVGGRKTIFQK